MTQTPITYDWKKILPEKKVQSSGRLCFSAGSNYNRKKLRPGKKVQSSGRQLKSISDNRLSVVSKYKHLLLLNTTGNNYNRKKGTVVWSSVGAQNTTHNTHRHTNQQDEPCHPLPSSGFAPSLSMGRVVAPPNHGAAAPQRHAQAVSCWGCARCRWFACLGRRNKRH